MQEQAMKKKSKGYSKGGAMMKSKMMTKRQKEAKPKRDEDKKARRANPTLARKTRTMMGGGMTKSKMSSKGGARGGRMPGGMQAGGSTKMPMSRDPKTGEMKPDFAMDGIGKMQAGGKTMNMMTSDGVKMSPKMMANGGATMMDRKNGGNTVARGSGAARTQKFTKNG
jgi:hypothetical protein